MKHTFDTYGNIVNESEAPYKLFDAPSCTPHVADVPDTFTAMQQKTTNYGYDILTDIERSVPELETSTTNYEARRSTQKLAFGTIVALASIIIVIVIFVFPQFEYFTGFRAEEVTTEAHMANWTDEQPREYDKLFFADGSYYIGGIVDGQFHGYGRITFTDGIYFEGNFVNNSFNGHGRLAVLEGSHFFTTGNVTWTFNSNTDFIYKGEFRDGQFHGFGRLVFPCGCYDAGEFRNGQFLSHIR